jgi:hypothetical protein
VIGGRLAGRIPEVALRKGFGWFVLGMGGLVLVQQAPAGAALPLVGAIVVLAAAAGLCYRFVAACPLRRSLARV